MSDEEREGPAHEPDEADRAEREAEREALRSLLYTAGEVSLSMKAVDCPCPEQCGRRVIRLTAAEGDNRAEFLFTPWQLIQHALLALRLAADAQGAPVPVRPANRATDDPWRAN